MIGLGPNFTKLWLAQAVSNVSDGVHVTALPLVAASLIRDPLSVSAVWRLETFKFSTDPGLEAKVRDVVGLYLDPQERAIVVCVDEKIHRPCPRSDGSRSAALHAGPGACGQRVRCPR